MMRSTGIALSRKVAVVLAGCGVYDGSEIHEATSVLIHLDAKRIAYDVYAPNIEQMHVLNHQAGKPADGETRNVMVESARIARGPVGDVATLKADGYGAIVFPGGFGVMKNLSTFATEGGEGKVRTDVAAAIASFRAAEKPIAAACIAPVLVAATVPGAKITLGAADGDAQGLCRNLGANVVPCEVDSCVVDDALKIVTTPAYMCDVGPAKIYASIGSMIDKLEALLAVETVKQ
eukprot:CAMPEP_0174855252 /NCGR_PEP_ID=MMETSP1114-20130205/32844_1 /TAXON_ID=312471 /ORGANISM="Neobodo designis, Strain CCAP 1951/1" /LENGTH=233 /DNA_ID=CAMNT_0016089987 /DNA_START=43 /DNA_END=744 /DNA_ORIENTATION=+